MKMIKRYTIGELAEATGISRRAVRFYVQTGVIAAPEGKGRGSYYTDKHLEAIRSYRKDSVSASASPPSSQASIGEYVVRINLEGGIVLELPAACELPSEQQIAALEEILKTLY